MNVIPFTIQYPQDYLVIHSNQDTFFLAESIPNVKEVFRSLKLYQIDRNARTMLTRLVLLPSARITSSILSTIKKNQKDFNKCVSLQIRMGGEAAVFQEQSRFLTPRIIKKQMRMINTLYTKNETMYITSDSQKILASSSWFFTYHKVLISKDFVITHSGMVNKKDYKDGMKRAIADAVLAARCDTIYTTPLSSYGDLIQALSYHKTVKAFSYD